MLFHLALNFTINVSDMMLGGKNNKHHNKKTAVCSRVSCVPCYIFVYVFQLADGAASAGSRRSKTASGSWQA